MHIACGCLAMLFSLRIMPCHALPCRGTLTFALHVACCLLHPSLYSSPLSVRSIQVHTAATHLHNVQELLSAWMPAHTWSKSPPAQQTKPQPGAAAAAPEAQVTMCSRLMRQMGMLFDSNKPVGYSKQ
jgi:hypothetical protein